MTVELTREQLMASSETLRSPVTQVHSHQDTEYELDQSESLTFLYNLLYDEQSCLTKADILNILNSLKMREETLPFSITSSDGKLTDIQGVRWTNDLRDKFYADRRRIGSMNWFHNIPGSFQLAQDKPNINHFKNLTEFFTFNKFYSKLKLHITHFQLRNLVCSSNLSKGVFYPLSYFHDHNLNAITNFNTNDSIDSFFKINRLINDDEGQFKDSMKLDCIIDSRTLSKNSNSRISTLSCSDNYLVSGTFEGNYILTDIYDPDNIKHLGEYNLTNDYDGITNSIVIDDQQLIISSNDKAIRYIDLNNTNINSQVRLPFAANCLALNKFNPNQVFISADDLVSIIYDKRMKFNLLTVQQFKGQEDHSFSCDWSPTNENWLLSGNQDGNVRIWDKRNSEVPLYCWNGSLGTNSVDKSGPVRNSKFSNKGEFICWAESLDHIGLVNVKDLPASTDSNGINWVQSIDFIGKCTGLSFCESENGYGEQLLIGVNDCPLGGILSYGLESRDKCLDFDFYF